uniref:Uncharacterized protein n=1 Tax=Cannabis sativa TaxID=3483 RepID=A0A803NKX1_CANSA
MGGRGDASGQKSLVKRSKVDDMSPKSIIPSTKTPPLTVEKSSAVLPIKVLEEAVSDDRVLLEVNDQLAEGEDMSEELLMGSFLKESTREVEETKMEAEQKSFQLSKVNKQLLADNKLVEDLRKEISDMSSTAQLEADNEALAKDVNSLKDEREGLQTFIFNLTGEKKVLEETLDSQRTKFGTEQKLL